MKKFTIEVSHASPVQLTTIATELKIMGNDWERFGPRITINGHELQPPKLRLAPTEISNKRATNKRHNSVL